MFEDVKWDLRFLRLAEHIGGWSKDPSTRCGAVLTDLDRTVVSVGYNGFPRGIKDTEERLNDRSQKYPLTVHCEMNAVLLAGRPVTGCTLYTWPCISCSGHEGPGCAVHMIQAGIRRAVFPTPTGDMLSRWADSLQRTKELYREAGVSYREIAVPEEDQDIIRIVEEYEAPLVPAHTVDLKLRIDDGGE